MAEFSDVPVELLINIFLRFLAKPLTQFKCVCKSWYQLISSPEFATLHLDQTLKTPSSSNLRFVFSSPNLSSADFDTFEHITELDHPFRNHGQGYAEVLGSCHGLLCLHNYDASLPIILYNPTTQTHKKLPFLPNPSNLSYCRCFGFGFDSVSGDYKFVRILQSDEDTAPFWSQVMVYSLKTDSWTRAQDVPRPSYGRREIGVLLNEDLHWVYEKFNGISKNRRVVSFNLNDYTFSEVAQPEYGNVIAVDVGVLDGCLCLLANDLGETDIWVMKEYGVVGSWTRLFKVSQLQNSMFEWPIAFSVNRRELILQLNIWRVVSLDLEAMVVKEVKVGESPRCFDTHVCVENLMMLKDADCEDPDTDHQCGFKRRRQIYR